MKKKWIVLFISLILLLSAVTVYAADAIYGYFLGFDRVKVFVDGEELYSQVPAFIIENTTVLPLRALAESLDIIVKWDDDHQTAHIIKPNVNMQFTANPVFDKEKKTYVVYSPFGKIPPNKRYNFEFHVYSEVDNLPYELVEVKVVLRDPDDEVVQEGFTQMFDATDENSLQYIKRFEDVTFVKTGNYYVEMLLKSESTGNEFVKIGEKMILVK